MQETESKLNKRERYKAQMRPFDYFPELERHLTLKTWVRATATTFRTSVSLMPSLQRKSSPSVCVCLQAG